MFTLCDYKSAGRVDEHLEYLFSKPEGDEKLPLLIYIHGAGGLGVTTEQLKYFAFPTEMEKRKEYKCVAVMPRCHKKNWYELFDVLLEFIESMINRDDVDADRVYLMGESMGGYTTWQVAMTRPEWFAAIVPICGGGMYWSAPALRDMGVWAHHGALDTTVYPQDTINMVNAVNLAGGHARISIYADYGHDSWVPALASDEVWKWLFSCRKKK